MEYGYEEIAERLDLLYKKLGQETTEHGLEITKDIINWEIQAEKFCNQ